MFNEKTELLQLLCLNFTRNPFPEQLSMAASEIIMYFNVVEKELASWKDSRAQQNFCLPRRKNLVIAYCIYLLLRVSYQCSTRVVPRFGLDIMKNTCEGVYLLIKLRVVDGCFQLITSSRAQGIIYSCTSNISYPLIRTHLCVSWKAFITRRLW